MLQAQIFIDKDEIHDDKPMNEFVMDFLIHHNIIGATSFRGHAGFGKNQYMKNPSRLFSFDEPPMLIVFIDEDEKVLSVLRELRKQMQTGFIVTSKVDKFE